MECTDLETADVRVEAQVEVERVPDEGTRSALPHVMLPINAQIQLRDPTQDPPPEEDDENPIPNRPLVRHVNRMRANFLPLAIAHHQNRVVYRLRAHRLETEMINQINQRGCDLYARGELTLAYLRKNFLNFALGPILKRRYILFFSNLGLLLFILSGFLTLYFRSAYFAYIWLVYETLISILTMILRKMIHREQLLKFDNAESIVVVMPLIPMVH